MQRGAAQCKVQAPMLTSRLPCVCLIYIYAFFSLSYFLLPSFPYLFYNRCVYKSSDAIKSKACSVEPARRQKTRPSWYRLEYKVPGPTAHPPTTKPTTQGRNWDATANRGPEAWKEKEKWKERGKKQNKKKTLKVDRTERDRKKG